MSSSHSVGGSSPTTPTCLARWGREFGVSVANPFGLLTALGEDVPGAMQFVRDERISEVALGKGHVDWLSDEEVGALLRAVRRDHTAWLGAHGEGRWSLAGAQAKIALYFDGQRWGRPAGRLATTHIFKPAITGLDDHDLNEHICLRAARLLGLRAVTSRFRIRRGTVCRCTALRPRTWSRRTNRADPPRGSLPGHRNSPLAEVPKRRRSGSRRYRPDPS